MTNKVYYNEYDVKGWVHSIIQNMIQDRFYPDYVVGITRGGLTPALMLSQYLNVPMNTLKVSLRDDKNLESNTWMADEAFGYTDLKKKILIVDDINDTGATLNWIKQDWQASCLPKDPSWDDDVWNYNVKFAVLVNNESSDFKKIDYVGLTIDKEKDPQWIVFPWETWWI